MEQINYAVYIENTITIILAIAGLITAIGGAVIMLKKWFNTSNIRKNTLLLGEHDKKINELDERLKAIEDNLNEQNDFTKVMCNSMLALLDHNINGNSIESLKSAKNEIKEYLIQK